MAKKLQALAAAAAIAVLAAACASPPPPAAAPPPDSFTATSGAPIPLSYLVREGQKRWQAEQGVGAWITRCASLPGAEWSDHDWRSDNQQLVYETQSGDQLARITFSWIGFDPSLSALTYGDTKVISNVEDEVAGTAYLIQNGSADPIDFSRDETVTEHQERTASTSTEIEDDVTATESATETIGGEELGGASFEESLQEHWGLKTDTTTATTESTDRTVTVHLATEVAEGKSTLGTITQATVHSQTPFTLDGVWDAGVHVEWDTGTAWTHSPCLTAIQDTDADNRTSDGHWAGVKWSDWDSFEQMLAGTNVAWPSAGPSTVHSDTHAIGVIGAEWARRIEMSGVQKRTYSDSTEAEFVDVTGEDPGDVIERHSIDRSHVITG